MTEEEFRERFYDIELEHDVNMLERKLKHQVEMDKWPNRWLALFIISLIAFTYWLVKVLT
jgi:hypothetical protein